MTEIEDQNNFSKSLTTKKENLVEMSMDVSSFKKRNTGSNNNNNNGNLISSS